MNSKDRRKHNRKLPFTVDIKREFPADCIAIVTQTKWCNKQFGKKNWERHGNWYFHTYKFKLEKHRTWFMMRWS